MVSLSNSNPRPVTRKSLLRTELHSILQYGEIEICGDIVWHHKRSINMFAKTVPLKLRRSRVRFY